MGKRAVRFAEYQCLLRNDLASFIERAFYELSPAERLQMHSYIELIAMMLEACRLGTIRRLIINLPPRHLKSHCASIAFVAWLLGHNPGEKIICASYGQDLADKFARDTRTIMQASWYQNLFATRLSDRQAMADFETTAQGGRIATSVDGALTGRGANFIIIDDPLKPADALSDTQRRKVNDWYDGTLLSRLNDKNTGCIIMVMQRLHQDDLVGHVLSQEDWEVLSFPARAEQDQTFEIRNRFGVRQYNRREGDILHPQRESAVTLDVIRKNLGEYNFSAQYQQNPIPVGGAIVKLEWLRYYEPSSIPKFSRIVQSWDTANKANELNDYSVCTTWGVHNKNFYLLSVFRARLNYPELKRKVVALAKPFESPRIVIEDKASGTQLIQELRSEIYGIQPFELPSGMDKTMRLHAQTDLFENGFVFLPTSASWLADYVAELTSFPGSRFYDQVDSTTQALAYMRGSSALEIWARLGRD